MKFPYHHFTDKNDPNLVISKPMIAIRLSHGNKGINLLALIDSGADLSLFHKSVADALEIDLANCPTKEFRGISGKIVAYLHQVHLTIINLSSIDLTVGFTESDGVAALLGQSGFFDGFDITFVRSANVIDIKAHS